MTDQQLNNAIDHSSKVTVRLIVSAMSLTVPLLVVGVGFQWRINQTLQELHYQQKATNQQMAAYERDRYSIPMATADAMREAIANPGHKVPDPSNSGVLIQVTNSRVTRTGADE